MNNVRDYILEISNVVNESEVHVMEALYGAYEKMMLIEDHYDDTDSVCDFAIFQEGKIADDVKRQGKDMNTLEKIVTLLPRFIIALYNAISRKANNNLGQLSFEKQKEKKIDTKKVVKTAGALGFIATVVGGSVIIKKKKSKNGDKDSSSTESLEYGFKIDADGNIEYIGSFKIELMNKCLDKLSEKIKKCLSDPNEVLISYDVNYANIFVNEGEKESGRFSKDVQVLIKEYNKADQKIKKISEDFKNLSDTFKKYAESKTDDEKRWNEEYLKYRKHIETISDSINGAITWLGDFKKSIEAVADIQDKCDADKTENDASHDKQNKESASEKNKSESTNTDKG